MYFSALFSLQCFVLELLIVLIQVFLINICVIMLIVYEVEDHFVPPS